MTEEQGLENAWSKQSSGQCGRRASIEAALCDDSFEDGFVPYACRGRVRRVAHASRDGGPLRECEDIQDTAKLTKLKPADEATWREHFLNDVSHVD